MNLVMEWNAIVKLCIALVLGLLGAGQQYRYLPVHVFVCMGTCFFTLMAVGIPGMSSPVWLIADAHIMAGAGLVGAVIMMKEQSFTVGLTNAASLWGVAAAGMAVGYAYYIAALCVTAILYAASWFHE